ncbi:MAG: TetR/AcrR family transcriptional regulator [Clostridia bacterium]|nr:TetR/AcrR family transcriptional regulator [Clostridia bacterium]
MPPNVKYTKEQITQVAYEMVRKHGMEILTARGLAAELGTSTAPIFTAFQSIEEVQTLVLEKAKQLYVCYLNAGLQLSPPFKGTGLKYIQFAKDEPELFKLLFMQGDENEEITHFFPAADENTATVLNTVKSSYSLNEEKAKKLYNHLSVYTHGLAVLYAQRRCVFTMEDISLMLTEIFNALTKGEIK